jgi:hypothetical protein
MSWLNPAKAAARREAFYAARRRGLSMWDAGVEAGVTDPGTMRHYEHWFQAVESGAEFLGKKKDAG